MICEDQGYPLAAPASSDERFPLFPALLSLTVSCWRQTFIAQAPDKTFMDFTCQRDELRTLVVVSIFIISTDLLNLTTYAGAAQCGAGYDLTCFIFTHHHACSLARSKGFSSSMSVLCLLIGCLVPRWTSVHGHVASPFPSCSYTVLTLHCFTLLSGYIDLAVFGSLWFINFVALLTSVVVAVDDVVGCVGCCGIN